jgi:hypothetical protein
MYHSFMVRDFRCFQELTLVGLERVNLIAGMNNVGKTALLEALFLHCGAYNPELTMRINAFRGIETVKIDLGRWVMETPWDSLFHQFDITKTIELAGEDTVAGHRALRLRVLREPSELAQVTHFINRVPGGTQEVPDLDKSQRALDTSERAKVLQLEYQEKGRHGKCYMILDFRGIRTEPIPPIPPFPAFFQGARTRVPFREEAERFGRLEIRGEQDVVLRVLQLLEPRLKRLATIVVAGEPILHGDIGTGRLMPLAVMGEGMVRLASLVMYIASAPQGVVLVDEIENGLHYSVLPKVWWAIGEVARRFDTQVFATTHSLECIVAAHRAFSKSERYDFRLHRLERVNGTIRAVTYDQETLEAACEAGLEVR